MNHQRFFDISFINDEKQRRSLQNAIDGVNMACSDNLDAWLYVTQGYIFNDMKKLLRSSDSVPITIFNNMEQDSHNEESLYQTISDLCSISNDYESWKSVYNQKISLLEDSRNFWNIWRTSVLSEHYKIIYTKEMMGNLLNDFLILKYQRNDTPSDLEKEIIDRLGQTLQEKIDTLENILKNTNTPSIRSYYSQLLLQKEDDMNEIQHYSYTIKEALRILEDAIQSKNPVAIQAALNPGWTSLEFISSNQYKNAINFLNGL